MVTNYFGKTIYEARAPLPAWCFISAAYRRWRKATRWPTSGKLQPTHGSWVLAYLYLSG